MYIPVNEWGGGRQLASRSERLSSLNGLTETSVRGRTLHAQGGLSPRPQKPVSLDGHATPTLQKGKAASGTAGGSRHPGGQTWKSADTGQGAEGHPSPGAADARALHT